MYKFCSLCKECEPCVSFLNIYIISLLCFVYVEMSELIVLFCMMFHKNEVNSFDIASMEENSRSINIFSLSPMVNSSISLERGGQVNLSVITETILLQF